MPRFVRRYALAASAVRTDHAAGANGWGGTQNMQGEKGFRVDIDVAAFTGTSITFTLQFLDPTSGTWQTLLASAAVAAAGHTVLQVSPDIVAAANLTAQVIPPAQWRLMSTGTITSVTWGAYVTFQMM